MKHWSLHRRLKKNLRNSRVPLNPDFVAKTRAKLYEQAQKQLSHDPASRLAFNWMQMKRYSFAYFSFLLLIVLGTYTVLPSRSISAQELIESASANYETNETNDGTIYYEKRETTDYGFPNEPYTTENPYVTTEEVWSNNTGDLLQLVNRNGEEVVGTMIKLNEFGVPIDYEALDLAEPSTEEKTMADSIKRGAIYCANIEIEGEDRKEALLQVSKENPAYWFISAEVGGRDKSGYGFVETHGGSYVKELLEQILSNLSQNNDFSETNHYTLKQRTEGSAEKYVLTETHSDDQHTDYIFDAQSFTLERQEYYVNELLYSKTVYLEHATFPASERDKVFDPESKGLTENQFFTTLIPGYIEESGCYDNHVKLSEEETTAFLATLPEEARKGYEDTVLSQQNNRPYPDAENPLLIPDESSFIFPSAAHMITQGFTENHPGIDISREADSPENPEIYASALGIVTSAETGYNEGYGNTIEIDHGNGYITRYTHLKEFYVELGDHVTQGQLVGLMGNTGRVYGRTGICLHFELIYNGIKVNPLNYFSL